LVIFDARDQHVAALALLVGGDRRRVPLDVGGDCGHRFVGIPVLRWRAWLVTTLLLVCLDDFCVDLETLPLMGFKPRFEFLFCVTLTGEDAVGEFFDRVFELFFGSV